MEPYWTVFYDTGDPLAYLLYRCHPRPTQPPLVPHPHGKEATPWPPPLTL